MSEKAEKNKLRLKIAGSQFLITADESEQYIQKIARIVDQRIKYLADNNQKLSIQMATIMAALNYCDQLEKERVITRELIKKTDECETIARDATQQLNRLLVENEQLKEEKAGLHKVIAELKAGIHKEENINKAESDPKTKQEEKEKEKAKSAPQHQSKATPLALNSVKTAPAKLNSIKSKSIENAQIDKSFKGVDPLFTRDEFADVVTDEELMNLLNEES